MNFITFSWFNIFKILSEYKFLTISGFSTSVINLPTNKLFFSPASPISTNSFFQTNSYQVKALYDYIIKTAKLKKSDILYDLYCGTGTIGIYISSYVKKVYGIDIVEDAITNAKDNTIINKVDNIEFFCADLKDILNNESINKIEKPDVVIIDPPRPGLHPSTIKYLINLSAKKIIYVSCNPATMARDIEILSNQKYCIKDMQPIDMFPHTPHIECITTLMID